MPRSALIVIDLINTYEHPDGDALMRSVEGALPAVQRLIRRAHEAGAPVIYVNDNFGAWRSDRDELLETVLASPNGHLVEPIKPNDDALFVIKARHSVFFQTPLEYLLGREGVERVVLVGQATEQCVLYSALDAHIRHLEVSVPRDAVAHIHEDLAAAALRLMELNMGADVVDADEIRF